VGKRERVRVHVAVGIRNTVRSARLSVPSAAGNVFAVNVGVLRTAVAVVLCSTPADGAGVRQELLLHALHVRQLRGGERSTAHRMSPRTIRTVRNQACLRYDARSSRMFASWSSRWTLRPSAEKFMVQRNWP